MNSDININKGTHLQYIENHRVNEHKVTERRCTRCKKWKIENKDNFYMMNKSKPELGFMSECIECVRIRANEYRQENLERQKSSRMDWHWKNKDYDNMKNRQWKKDNVERKQEYQTDWQKNNPDKIAMYGENRRMHKSHNITKFEWIACKEYFNNCCAYCGLPIEEHYRIYAGKKQKIDLHKEHVDDNGTNDLTNCVPSCQSCNSQKWKFSIEEWYNDSNINFTVQRLDKIIKWMMEDCYTKTELKKQI